MRNLNEATDINIIHTIEHYENEIYYMKKGFIDSTDIDLWEKELAELTEELKRRYPDAV